MLRGSLSVILVLLVSGCGSQVAAPALPVAPAQTQALSNGTGIIDEAVQALINRRTVTVSGEGTVRVPPDTATVNIGLEQKGIDANTAQSKANVAAQRVIEAWKAQGASDSSIQTVGMDLFPEYARPEATGIETMTGYKAVMRLQVRTTPAKAGDRVDAALNAGANRLEGVAFSVEDNVKARQQAIAKAINKALKEAHAALGPMDLKVKEVQRIEIGGGSTPPIPLMGGAMMERATVVQTPVQPGELEIRAVVTIVATF
ncbi:MAG: SIMPL domain-containing protein [Candidatus Sericytochromatia bacterium]|nr:SIMPL domain-containing protein [Candidatus Sericytochromatia bacterium]